MMGERSGLESLFRNKCLDAMAMQTMQLQHPNRAAGHVQTGNFGKDWEVVVRIVIEWWRRTEVRDQDAERRSVETEQEGQGDST